MKGILFNQEMVQAILENRKTATRRLVKPHNPVKSSRMGGYHQGNGLWIDKEDGYIKDYSVSCTWWGIEEYIKRFAPYRVGDILYVRETWLAHTTNKLWHLSFKYKADDEIIENISFTAKRFPKFKKFANKDKWQPSLFMPKEAARIFLKVTDVRVERLQDITEEQAIKEGIVHMFDHLSEETYKRWAHGITDLKQYEQPWNNYLWHGNFGNCGCGNKISDAWKYQKSGYENPIGSFSSLWNLTVPLEKWELSGWHANSWVWVIEFERISKEETYEDR